MRLKLFSVLLFSIKFQYFDFVSLLLQVHAVRSDGRRQRVIYTFLHGNELGAFEINSNNGLIRVRDPEMIDYERNREFVLTIAGQGLGEENLNAYAKCVIKVRNVNDNTPR